MTAEDRKTLTEHLGFIERMTANSKRSHGWTFDEEIAALRRVLAEDRSPKSGDVLIQSPLGTEPQACGNRAVVDNPTTIRVQ